MDAHTIAERLTKAQRTAFERMEIREPHSFMPEYRAVKFYGGDLPPLEIDEMQKLGLVSLPIATGGRGSPTYHGEVHPLGLEVRNILLNGEGK